MMQAGEWKQAEQLARTIELSDAKDQVLSTLAVALGRQVSGGEPNILVVLQKGVIES